MEEVGIRQFLLDDIEAILNITLVCFNGISIDQNVEKKFGLIGGRDWGFRKRLEVLSDLKANPQGTFVAEVRGEVVGYITTSVDPETKIGRIRNLAVTPEYRRRGIGVRLVKTALDSFREQGMEMAKVEALEQNEVATKFYPKIGFVEVARQIHYVMPLRRRS